MSSEIPFTRSVHISVLGEFLRARGLDIKPLLKPEGVELSDLEDPLAEVPLSAIVNILEFASEKLGDPCLGLTWSQSFPAGGSGIFGYLMLNARTLREAILNSVRYANFIAHPIETSFAEVDHGGEIVGEHSWEWPSTLPEPSLQYRLFIASLYLSRLRAATVKPWTPHGVELQFREPQCRDLVRRIFGPNIVFNAPVGILRVSKSDLQLALPKADTRLLAIVKDIAERLLAELPNHGELVQQVRGVILSRLGKSDITLEAIAGGLEMPERTLQAKLAQQGGTAFETILNETRQTLARHYLVETGIPLTEIALMLGFSELSAFTRAAQRWFGMAPSAYRRLQKQHVAATP